MCGRNAADFKPTMFKLDWLRYSEPILDTVEEVTLMSWGEPTVHPEFVQMMELILCYFTDQTKRTVTLLLYVK